MRNIWSPDEKDLNLFDGEEAPFATTGCWRFAMILLPAQLDCYACWVPSFVCSGFQRCTASNVFNRAARQVHLEPFFETKENNLRSSPADSSYRLEFFYKPVDGETTKHGVHIYMLA